MIPQHIWQGFRATHGVGDLVEGVVTDVVPFGSFVETEGVTGLLHAEQRSVGERVSARILDVDDERQRFSLEAV